MLVLLAVGLRRLDNEPVECAFDAPEENDQLLC